VRVVGQNEVGDVSASEKDDLSGLKANCLAGLWTGLDLKNEL
jgi:hypothetical protein